MAARPKSDPSAIALLDMIGAQRITAVIYVTAQLGIADLLAEGPKTSGELAGLTGAHERSLQRLLRALVTLGLCKQARKGTYQLTPMGGYLAEGAKHSLKAWAIFEGESLSRSWMGLLESIRTGKTAAALAGFENPFEQMAQNPKAAKIFNDAMVAWTRLVIPAVLAAYDFSGITNLIDVGGGYGELLSAILVAYPSMHGTILDLPQCAEGASRHLVESGVSERGKFVPGNFFDSVPGSGDAIIMKSIIHDWEDGSSRKILDNCHRALPQEGRLLLVERVMPEAPAVNAEDSSGALSDLNMLRGPGGSERTESEFRELLKNGGFTMTYVLPAGRMNVIEARRA